MEIPFPIFGTPVKVELYFYFYFYFSLRVTTINLSHLHATMENIDIKLVLFN